MPRGHFWSLLARLGLEKRLGAVKTTTGAGYMRQLLGHVSQFLGHVGGRVRSQWLQYGSEDASWLHFGSMWGLFWIDFDDFEGHDGSLKTCILL